MRKTHHKKNSYNFGIMAEKVAMCFLRLKGYRILFWRYKTYFGEIDIIAKKGKTIAIVEVKARNRETPRDELLRPKQIERIRKATEALLVKNPSLQSHHIRFDFISINRFFAPKHFKNYW